METVIKQYFQDHKESSLDKTERKRSLALYSVLYPLNSNTVPHKKVKCFKGEIQTKVSFKSGWQTHSPT